MNGRRLGVDVTRTTDTRFIRDAPRIVNTHSRGFAGKDIQAPEIPEIRK